MSARIFGGKMKKNIKIANRFLGAFLAFPLMAASLTPLNVSAEDVQSEFSEEFFQEEPDENVSDLTDSAAVDESIPADTDETAAAEVYYTGTGSRIHILALDDSTEAILLESNGRFGMVDSGESTDYPDGSDSRYPDRSGTTKTAGHESSVIAYLQSAGVTADNFDFYIGTHAHSDHIGTAPTVINTFRPRRVYTQEYKDSYIDSSSGRLFDNLYCYDNMLEAAQNAGASIILNYDPSAAVYPDRVDVNGTITWDDEENASERPASVDVSIKNSLTGEETVVSAEYAQDNIYTFSLQNQQKFADDGSEISYTAVLDPPAGYILSQSGSYSFILSRTPDTPNPGEEVPDNENPGISATNAPGASVDYVQDENIVNAAEDAGFDAGVTDSENSGGEEGTSDNMVTSSIPAEDIVDPADESDPANIVMYNARYGCIGKFDTITETQNTVASPVFTLGDMQVEIVHYGGDYKTNPKFDANYFSLGVLVTVNGEKAFIGGDINNYEGAETALASQIGHVSLQVLNHHGYYGSNTSTFMNSLSPDYAVIAGTGRGLSKLSSDSSGASLFTILQSLSDSGTPFYASGTYSNYTGAVVYTFGSGISVPTDVRSLLYYNSAPNDQTVVMYRDGFISPYSGEFEYRGNHFRFANSAYANASTWVQNSGKWYYLDRSCHITTGWQEIGDHWYYFNNSGVMQTGWQKIDRKWYYFNSSGEMQTGWQKLSWSGGSDYFYFYSSGAMAVSTSVDGYSVNADGVRVSDSRSGWVKTGSRWYYYRNGSKVTGWLQDGGRKYYLSAASSDKHMITDWATISGKKYYFGTDGAMRTGWQKISGSWYYFNTSGVMQTGWQKLPWSGGSSYFYFYSDGKMAVSTTVGGYKVDANGVRGAKSGSNSGSANARNGWVQSGGRWFYYRNGSKVTGWLQNAGKTYYLSQSAGDAHMITDWATIGGKKYYFGSDGAMRTGWQSIGGYWYYFNGSGVMQTGWQKLPWSGGSNYFYFYSNGRMAVSTTVGGYKVDANGARIK